MLLEEQQIEQYRVIRSLGSGKVYLANDTRLNRLVAIRVVNAATLSGIHNESPLEVRQFLLKKLGKIANLDHPSLLRVYYYGVETIDDATFAFMVTPFYRDSPFIDWLQQQTDRGLLSPQMSASLIAQVAEALQHAHTQQVVHQQLAFSKLLLHRKAVNSDIPDLWVTGFEPEHADQSDSGEPLSMAPEQWQGRAVPATDQYALAVIAYRLFTGEFPFKGSREQVKDQHLRLQPQPPSHHNAELPPLVDMVLLKALAKQPEKRFVSVTAFASALTEAAQSKNGLCSTFVINSGEAQRGVSRVITLPENRHINLTIPAGAYDGQIIYRRGQGAEDLFVTISIDETLPDVPRTVETDAEASTLVSRLMKREGQLESPYEDLCNEPTFRDDLQGHQYTFLIRSNGKYEFYKFSSYNATLPLISGSSSAIKTGLKHTNLIAVIAHGKTLDLYVNNQRINSVNDGAYGKGAIAVCASTQTGTTEVAFNNAKVWTL